MSPSALAAGASFQVADGLCTTVLTAPVGADLGSWSSSFPHVYDIDLSSIGTNGHYTVQVSAGAITAGAVIDVGAGPALYGPLLSNALFFYKAQRDGPNVDSTVLSRMPSHLKDETATVYSSPSYATDGSDVLLSTLNSVGSGTVDVSGGWFDAGDYLKFVETASYVVSVMLVSVRDHAATLSSTGQADFTSEAAYGIDWLLRMWSDDTQTLLYQVGIGNGSSALNIVGDHERQWQLPEVDDTLGEAPGDPEYYVEYRPALQVRAGRVNYQPQPGGAPRSRLRPLFAGVPRDQLHARRPVPPGGGARVCAGEYHSARAAPDGGPLRLLRRDFVAGGPRVRRGGAFEGADRRGGDCVWVARDRSELLSRSVRDLGEGVHVVRE